jgi:iron complex transport system substrate-binding protein
MMEDGAAEGSGTVRHGRSGRALGQLTRVASASLTTLLILLTVACRRPREGSLVARRVVSLSPSTTEALAAIGARSALVGRSRYCDYPPDVASLPEVGGYVDPNFEAIVALHPDLVTGARGPAGAPVAEQLAAKGAEVYFPPTETLSEIDEMILGLGTRTGHEVEARVVISNLQSRETAIEKAVATTPRVRTLLVFGLAPIVAAGPKSFADEMLWRAGATNVVTEGTSYPTLGIERVLALDPDLIIDAAMNESLGQERIAADAPGWRELHAVKAGKVVSLRDEVVLRPGPRVGDGLAVLARAIHPEVKEP